jgi:quercetin dioxygenase-like cupin family protein
MNASKARIAQGVLAVVALVAVIFVGQAWATSGSGTQSTLVGRATFDDPINVRRVGEDKWKVDVKAKPALDVAVQSIVFQPGGQSGWHSHPGPVFISVVSGEMTFYESDDPDCEPIVRRAGEGYLDTGDHAHIARNESGAPATNVVTYFAPPGAALRIDEPAPGNCPF